MTRFAFIPLFCVVASAAYAHEMIFYKYAEGDDYSMFISPADKGGDDPSARSAIARKLTGAGFSLESVPRDFYQIKVTPDIVFFGYKLTQYEITPLSEDRFSHTVWVDKDGNLVKTEVYDTDGRLVFAFSGMDFLRGPPPRPGMPLKKPPKEVFKPNKAFYKGFRHVSTKTLPDGVIHIVFMDGLNRFSVFIDPHPDDDGTVSKIIYGNYLLSKVIDGAEYTVIGSVPYPMMEEVIDILNKSKSKLTEAVAKGAALTDDLYNAKTNMEDILK